MKRLLTILFVFLISCASKKDMMYSRINVNQYYRQSGVMKYILPALPTWANSSSEANCKRSYQNKYFNIDNMIKSYGISFEDALQTQYSYNLMYQNAIYLKKVDPTPKEEEQLFFKSLDKVKAGIKNFQKPTFGRVNIVWIDSYNGKNVSKLKSLMNSEDMMEGRPLLLSMCKTRGELRRYLAANKIPLDGSRMLTYEIFSSYTKNGSLGNKEALNLDAFRLKNQKFYLYYRKSKPKNILGNVIYKKY